MYLGQAFCARGIQRCEGWQWHTNSVVRENRAMDEIWRAVSARWGRPTQGFGRCHLGPSGSQFSLTGWGHVVVSMQVVLDLILGLGNLKCVEFY